MKNQSKPRLPESSLSAGPLAAERNSICSAAELADYICRIGMVHMNETPYSHNMCNAWSWEEDFHFWPKLMDLVESREVFYCRALCARTTYVSPKVAKSLVAVAGDRAKDGLSSECLEVYELLREVPLSNKQIRAELGYSAKEVKKAVRTLLDQLLITAWERGKMLAANWSDLLYGTVDGWFLDQEGIDTEEIVVTPEDYVTVLTAASRCLISNDAKKLAKALKWPEPTVQGYLEIMVLQSG